MQICYETLIILNPDQVNTQDEINKMATLLGEQITNTAKVANLCIADLGKKTLAYLIKNHHKGYYLDLFYWAEEQQDVAPIIENILDAHSSVLKYITVKQEDITTPEDVNKHLLRRRRQIDFEWIKLPEQLNKPTPVIDAWDVIFGRATYPEE